MKTDSRIESSIATIPSQVDLNKTMNGGAIADKQAS